MARRRHAQRWSARLPAAPRRWRPRSARRPPPAWRRYWARCTAAAPSWSLGLPSSTPCPPGSRRATRAPGFPPPAATALPAAPCSPCLTTLTRMHRSGKTGVQQQIRAPQQAAADRLPPSCVPRWRAAEDCACLRACVWTPQVAGLPCSCARTPSHRRCSRVLDVTAPPQAATALSRAWRPRRMPVSYSYQAARLLTVLAARSRTATPLQPRAAQRRLGSALRPAHAAGPVARPSVSAAALLARHVPARPRLPRWTSRMRLLRPPAAAEALLGAAMPLRRPQLQRTQMRWTAPSRTQLRMPRGTPQHRRAAAPSKLTP